MASLFFNLSQEYWLISELQNLIRKATWYNHDYYRKLGTDEFRHPDKTLSVHVGM